MKKGDHKIFLCKEKLYLMVNYRIVGYSIQTLSSLFGCDTSSIRYQLDKYKISPPNNVFSVERFVSPAIAGAPRQTWEMVEGRKVNLGRNYADYFRS